MIKRGNKVGSQCSFKAPGGNSSIEKFEMAGSSKFVKNVEEKGLNVTYSTFQNQKSLGRTGSKHI